MVILRSTVAPLGNQTAKEKNKHQPTASGVISLLDSKCILITSLTKRIGYHEKTHIPVNTSCRSEG
jgi:hypothetical protein